MAQLGEQIQEKGRNGVHRAKLWLERTTRVGHSWTAYDSVPSVDLLKFTCPGNGASAGFDIGGTLRGENLEGQAFLAEVKDYGPNSDQYPEFKKFLALCYIAYTAKPTYCDHLIWITWRPFKCQTWDDLTSVNEVIEAVVTERERVFGVGVTQEDARSQVDLAAAAAVADRLWLIVLSERQETLVITRSHYAEVVRLITEGAAS